MIGKLFKLFGYYKKDEYTMYTLKELILADEETLKDMRQIRDTNKLYSCILGRKTAYQEVLEMMEEHYKNKK